MGELTEEKKKEIISKVHKMEITSFGGRRGGLRYNLPFRGVWRNEIELNQAEEDPEILAEYIEQSIQKINNRFGSKPEQYPRQYNSRAQVLSEALSPTIKKLLSIKDENSEYVDDKIVQQLIIDSINNIQDEQIKLEYIKFVAAEARKNDININKILKNDKIIEMFIIFHGNIFYSNKKTDIVISQPKILEYSSSYDSFTTECNADIFSKILDNSDLQQAATIIALKPEFLSHEKYKSNDEQKKKVLDSVLNAMHRMYGEPGDIENLEYYMNMGGRKGSWLRTIIIQYPEVLTAFKDKEGNPINENAEFFLNNIEFNTYYGDMNMNFLKFVSPKLLNDNKFLIEYIRKALFDQENDKRKHNDIKGENPLEEYKKLVDDGSKTKHPGNVYQQLINTRFKNVDERTRNNFLILLTKQAWEKEEGIRYEKLNAELEALINDDRTKTVKTTDDSLALNGFYGEEKGE